MILAQYNRKFLIGEENKVIETLFHTLVAFRSIEYIKTILKVRQDELDFFVNFSKDTQYSKRFRDDFTKDKIRYYKPLVKKLVKEIEVIEKGLAGSYKHQKEYVYNQDEIVFHNYEQV
jgi:hypothetical protein